MLAGAGLGLVLGGALTAMLVRNGSRLVAGATAGLVAYVLVLGPLFVFSGPSDTSASEMIGVAVFLVVPLGFCALAGAAIGSVVHGAIKHSRTE